MTGHFSLSRQHAAAEREFVATLRLRLRLAREDDLEALEWFGWFTPHREIIRATWDAQRAGTALMLLAVGGDFPVAQLWLDLATKRAEGVGVLWALRVMPGLQGAGIGSRLMAAAERLLHERGFAFAELGVEPENVGALRLYRRLGYVEHGRERKDVAFITPSGVPSVMHIHERLLRKRLTAAALVHPVEQRSS